MTLHLSYNGESFSQEVIPPTFDDLLLIAQVRFSLPDNDIRLMNTVTGEYVDEQVYAILLSNIENLESLSFSVVSNGASDAKEKKQKPFAPEELKLNGILNALFALTILNPHIDVSKVFFGDENQENKPPSHVLKKANASIKPDKASLKSQKSFGKGPVAVKKGRIYQP